MLHQQHVLHHRTAHRLGASFDVHLRIGGGDLELDRVELLREEQLSRGRKVGRLVAGHLCEVLVGVDARLRLVAEGLRLYEPRRALARVERLRCAQIRFDLIDNEHHRR